METQGRSMQKNKEACSRIHTKTSVCCNEDYAFFIYKSTAKRAAERELKMLDKAPIIKCASTEE